MRAGNLSFHVHHSANGIPGHRSMCGIDEPAISVDYIEYLATGRGRRCLECNKQIRLETARQARWKP